MESKLYNAVKNDGSDVLKEMAADTTLSVDHQLTPTNNTVLHLACQYGSMKCVKEILSVHESLLLNINSRGETALHLAARFGHYDVVVQLIAAAKSSQTLIRTQDVELETALHAAIRFNHRTVVELLVKEDPSHEHPQNMYEETPVYLATTRGYTDIIKTILNYCEFPTFGGPDGRTALHAAVLDRDGESMKLLLDERKDLMKVADNYGWTVYHYAAYNDLYTVVTDLASVDVSVGYQLDNEHKRTPLHVAAYEGHTSVLAALMRVYPDSWEISDGNGKNLMHLAVEKDRKAVVSLILSRDIVGKSLLMQRDKEGYTPLHLIAKSGHCYKELMEIRGALDWQVPDNKNFTPLDVLQMTDTEQAKQAIVRRVFNRKDVKKHWSMWRFRKNLDLEVQRDEKLGKEKLMKRYKTVINTHMVVAALITTVALTAGFAMSGGFDEKGSAVLRNAAFKTFIVADALALLFSMSSLFLYFVTTLSDDSSIIKAVAIVGVLFNSISVVAITLAFITGTYAVLPHLSNIAATVCVISSLFIILVVAAFAKILIFFCKDMSVVL